MDEALQGRAAWNLGIVLPERFGDSKGQPSQAVASRGCGLGGSGVGLRLRGYRAEFVQTVRSSFKRCGISTRLDGSEDGELNDRLASVTNGPEDPESLIDEALDLIFDSESDVSFDGFSDES